VGQASADGAGGFHLRRFFLLIGYAFLPLFNFVYRITSFGEVVNFWKAKKEDFFVKSISWFEMLVLAGNVGLK
jgi:hypothetical protein